MRSRSHSKRRETRNEELRPGDFALGSVESRAVVRAKLQPRVAYTLIIECPELPLSLELSTVERRLWPKGEIGEVVLLHGGTADIEQKELYEWIENHPILPS